MPQSAKAFLLCGLGLALPVAVAILPWEQFGAPFLVLLLGSCGLALWIGVEVEPSQNHRVLLLVGVSLLLRIVAAILFNAWLGPEGLLNDSISYDRVGWVLAQAWHSAAASPADLGSIAYLTREPFSNVVGAAYFLLGHSPAALIAFNCLLGAGIVYLTYALAVLLAGRDSAPLAGWLAALYSGFWVFSLMILKDNLTLFILLLFLVSFYRLVFANRASLSSALWLAVAVGCGLFLRALRDYVWVLAGFAALVVVLARLTEVRRGKWAIALMGLVLVGGLIGLAPRLAQSPIPWANLGSGSFLASYLTELPPSGTVLDLLRWASSHPEAFAKLAGLSIISSALAPYAWILPGLFPGTQAFNAYTVALPGMWLWYFLLPFAGIGTVLGLRRAPRRFVPALTLAILLFLLFALTIPRESRHRDMVMPILLILGAYGITSGWGWRRWGWAFWVPLFAAAAIMVGAVPSLIISAAGLALALGILALRERRARAKIAPV